MMDTRRLYIGLVVLCCAVTVGAAEPLAEFLFEDNLTNYGLPGGVGEFRDVGGAAATYVAGGLGGGQCLDNTAATGMGSYGPMVRVPATSDLAGDLVNLRSFTIMGWMKSAAPLGSNAGLVSFLSAQGFQLRCHSTNRLGLSLNGTYTYSSADANYGATDWKFFAVVYDGTRSEGNVRFYYGVDDATDSAWLDSTADSAAGTLFMDRAYFYVGNVATAGHAAFDGYLDSIRVFGSTFDDEGALTGEQIGVWKNRHDVDIDRLRLVDARFEGNVVSEGRNPDVGFINDWDKNGLFPQFSSGGVDGGMCLDMTYATTMGGRGPYFAYSDPYGVCGQLQGAVSFTVMGWMKSTRTPDNGARLFSYYNGTTGAGFELFAGAANRLTLSLDGNEYYSSLAGNYSCPDWKFFAVTYDGTKTSINLRFYFGHQDGTDSVTVDSVTSVSLGAVAGNVGGIGIGNRGTIFPFDGLLDSVKVFASQDDGEAALSAAAIRAYKNDHATTVTAPALSNELKKSDVAIMRTSSGVPAAGFAATRVVWNYDTHHGVVDGLAALGVKASQTFNTEATSYDGGINYADGKYYANDPTWPSRSRDFDGDLILKNNSTHYYPAVSSQAYQDDTFGRLNDALLPLRPFNVQYDTPMCERHAAYLGYGVGFHDETRADFRQYLDDKYSDAELLSLFNIADIASFDYRNYLQSEYSVVDNTDYTNRYENFALTEDFEHYLEDEIVDIFTGLRSDCAAASRPALISTNMGGMRWYNRILIPVIDFINLELPPAQSLGILDEGDAVRCKLAEAFEKPLLGCNNCNVSEYVLEYDKPEYMKCLIAAVYANGQVMLAPWNLWACETGRYYSDWATHGHLFHFVRDFSNCLDDYEPVSQVAVLWNCDNQAAELDACAADLFALNITFDVVPLGDRYPYSRFDPATVAAQYDQVVRCSALSSWTAANQTLVNDLATRISVVDDVGDLTLSGYWTTVSGVTAPADVWLLPRRHTTDVAADRVVHVVNRTYDRTSDTVDKNGCTITLDRAVIDHMQVEAVTWLGPESPQMDLPVTTDGNMFSVTLPSTPIWSLLKIVVRPRGDLSGDGAVDMVDLSLMIAQWLQCNTAGEPGCGAEPLAGDLSGDGWVNLRDFGVLRESYGQTVE